jgi:hypothetical protein
MESSGFNRNSHPQRKFPPFSQAAGAIEGIQVDASSVIAALSQR